MLLAVVGYLILRHQRAQSRSKGHGTSGAAPHMDYSRKDTRVGLPTPPPSAPAAAPPTDGSFLDMPTPTSATTPPTTRQLPSKSTGFLRSLPPSSSGALVAHHDAPDSPQTAPGLLQPSTIKLHVPLHDESDRIAALSDRMLRPRRHRGTRSNHPGRVREGRAGRSPHEPSNEAVHNQVMARNRREHMQRDQLDDQRRRNRGNAGSSRPEHYRNGHRADALNARRHLDERHGEDRHRRERPRRENETLELRRADLNDERVDRGHHERRHQQRWRDEEEMSVSPLRWQPRDEDHNREQGQMKRERRDERRHEHHCQEERQCAAQSSTDGHLRHMQHRRQRKDDSRSKSPKMVHHDVRHIGKVAADQHLHQIDISIEA